MNSGESVAEQNKLRLMVTGVAGFIGFHTAKRLLDRGYQVAGVDNLNDYYSTALKNDRLQAISSHAGFEFHRVDLADKTACEALFDRTRPTHVLHLAAQPGVRYSRDHPHAYNDSNATAFLNVLEGCRHTKVRHLVYASSSSVYGNSPTTPYRVGDEVDQPVSLYAATKRANELTAHAYCHLYGFAVTGLRYFTVYGPWGRPDMAVYLFTDAIKAGRPIDIFNNGDLKRDFTFIDDIAEGSCRVLLQPQAAAADDNGASGDLPCRLYNIGNNRPEMVSDLIDTLEDLLGKKAIKNYVGMQAGDVFQTFADIEPLKRDFAFEPATPLREGLKRFVDWHEAYCNRA